MLVLTGAAVAGATLLRWLVAITGLVIIDSANDIPLRIVDWKLLPSAIWEALGQFINLSGANIFSKTVELRNIHYFINLFVLACAISGLALFAKKWTRLEKKHDERWFVTVFFIITICMTFAAYIFGDQVVQLSESGNIISKGQERYITIIPFLTVVGLVWLVELLPHRKYLLIFFTLVTFLGLSTAVVNRQTIFESITINANSKITSFQQIGEILHNNNVDVTLSGHWYGTAVRFWSEDDITTSILHSCYSTQTFLTRNDWYTPEKATRNSALIIDRDGQDKYVWKQCNSTELTDNYGSPLKTIELTVWNGTSVDLWIYAGDIRTHLLSPNP